MAFLVWLLHLMDRAGGLHTVNGVLALFIVPVAPPQAPERAYVLVRQMGDNAFAIRQNADKELRQLAHVALVAVEKGIGDPDLEIAARCRSILPELKEDRRRWAIAVVDKHWKTFPTFNATVFECRLEIHAWGHTEAKNYLDLPQRHPSRLLYDPPRLYFERLRFAGVPDENLPAAFDKSVNAGDLYRRPTRLWYIDIVSAGVPVENLDFLTEVLNLRDKIAYKP